MLVQRLRWLLPALIVSWLNLQLAAALPAPGERPHVLANTFDPSAATSTIIREDNKRVHPPDGKNDTQPSHKLVASPAGLLRPDKFQFYTYNDKGDMITRQMTVQEIQGLIAAGGADHVAMDRQEPQKADDVLTGGKKVMDVVQKVQNVLKSALDKPPTLTGSIPKIPEHANAEWSNILPSILSGEADAISPSSESDQLSHKLTAAEKTGAGSGVVPSTDSSSNIDKTMSKNPPRKPVTSDAQTNAYAGFTNNIGKPQHAHNSQQSTATSEKPMIPVPVITLMEQKLSTLQSTVTESPVFQMLSVIPVGATESAHKQGQTEPSTINFEATVSAATVRIPAQTEDTKQAEQFVELTLSEVPEIITGYPQQPSGTKQAIAIPGNETGQVSNIYYLITTPSVSSESSTVTIKEANISGPSKVTSSADKTPPSNATYIRIPSKNNTGPSQAVLSVPGVTKESEINGTRDDNKIIPQTNAAAAATLGPLYHSLKPTKVTDKIVSSTSASTSRIEVTIRPHTGRPGQVSPTVTKESSSTVTATYTEHHVKPQSTESLVPMEPLPTQLIDSFSSVMSQVSQVKPSVLSLSPISDGAPPIPIMNINYDQRHSNISDPDKIGMNSQEDQLTSHADADENTSTERVAGAQQTYATVTKTTKAPLQDITTRITDSAATTTQRSTAAIIMNGIAPGIDNVSASSQVTATAASTAASTIEAMTNRVRDKDNAVTTSAGSKVTPESTTYSSIPAQFDSKTQNASLGRDPAGIAADAEKHVTDKIASVKVPVTLTVFDISKTRPTTTVSNGTGEPSSKPTLTNEYLNNVLTNLNQSDPVSTVDQILNIAPLPSTTLPIESIALPNDTLSSSAANVLASGLIAGFPTSTSKRPPTTESASSYNADPTRRTTASPNLTKIAGSAENVTAIFEKNAQHVASLEKKNITYILATTQGPELIRTKESNNASQPIKLKNDNEKVGNSTKGTLFPSPNRFANISDELKHNVAEDVSAGAVTTSSEQLLTANDKRPSVNKTLVASSNQDKKEDKQKIKTTETPVVKTDVSPGLPVKIPLIDSTSTTDRNSVNISGNVRNTSKIELPVKNNVSSTNVSLATKEVIKVHLANESNFVPHNSHNNKNNVTKGTTTASNIALNATVSPEMHGNTADPPFAQNSNRINNTTVYKHKGTDASISTTSHTATNNYIAVTTRTPVQNHKGNNESISPSSSLAVQQNATRSPVIKNVTQTVSSTDTSGNKEQSARPIFSSGVENSSSGSDTSNQNNKNAPLQQTASVNNASYSESAMRNASMQTHGQSNNTESKPASLKHSETLSKPGVIRLQLSTLSPTLPIHQTPRPTVGHKPLDSPDTSKTADADSNVENKWTLISQQVPEAATKAPKPTKTPKPTRKTVSSHQTPPSNADQDNNIHSLGAETMTHQQEESSGEMLPLGASQGASGLDVTTRYTSSDIVNFAKLCNELALNFWVSTNKGLSTARSLAVSPFGMTTLLAMIFLGARGPTSDQMNEVLGLDDVATFNPHLMFQNITDAVSLTRGQGIANAAFVRELFADKMKVRKLMPFYKEQAQQFYEGLVAEVNFATISDLVRRRTNLLVRKQTGGRIKDFVKTNTVPLRSPLAALSANVFQTDCNSTLTSSVGRDGELYFAVSPAVRQRKLVPVPATTWRSGVLAGYEPSIDATAVALGGSDRLVSTIFVLPGQQGHTAPGDTLDRLEQRIVRSAFRDGAWNKLLKVLIPRVGLELQVPKFSHRSVINATAALKRMGLDELFTGNADFKGINGVGHRLHLADVLQMNLFSTCGDENILGGRHHVETYPASPLRRNIGRQMQNIDKFAEDDTLTMHGGVSSQEDHVSFYDAGLHTARGELEFYREKRQLAKSGERPRLKLDRPFLYFVRHNPSGIILHMGRFNPRLLP